MLGNFNVRTDLALEAKEDCDAQKIPVRGVHVQEERDEEREIFTTTVKIETENGAKEMGKPVGTYITIEAPNLSIPDEGYHREISEELAHHLKSLIGEEKKSIFVVGLGNRDVTPDALGPEVIGNLHITRHVLREYGQLLLEGKEVREISSLVPGVMAQTGMETLEIIRGVIEEAQPDVMIVIDALAARSTKRLNRTIQITDAGIHPGSGVGNHRNGINRKSVGIPVIAIGVPTVVDAATIVTDTMLSLVEAMDESEHLRNLGGTLKTLNREEKYQMIREVVTPNLNTMFVTPKDIDETIKRISFTISEGINIAFA
ncbi:MAG: GPR endopeptidase [Lachnospiraceae bacterium]|nr:GPR endopeptidase [Robinsoniella sp.]MDY3767285.1 GPR endopeptidase [Lachnospiraceae bacterium]